MIQRWRSGNGVGRINEVTLRRARLVLGWVTCLGSTPGGGTLFRLQAGAVDSIAVRRVWQQFSRLNPSVYSAALRGGCYC